MMRPFSLLLLLVFIFSGTETFSIPFSQTQMKNCCCLSKVCKHKTSDRLCPLEKKAEENKLTPHGGAHCALREPGPAGVVLNALGCGSREEHKAAPAYSKDFFLKKPFSFSPFFGSEAFIHRTDFDITIFTPEPADRPPATPLLFSFI